MDDLFPRDLFPTVDVGFSEVLLLPLLPAGEGRRGDVAQMGGRKCFGLVLSASGFDKTKSC